MDVRIFDIVSPQALVENDVLMGPAIMSQQFFDIAPAQPPPNLSTVHRCCRRSHCPVLYPHESARSFMSLPCVRPCAINGFRYAPRYSM